MHTKTLIFSTILLMFSGCSLTQSPTPPGNHFYINQDIDLSEIGKVVLVQLDNKSNYPQISTDVTRSLFEELQKKQVFSLRVVNNSDHAWRSLQLNLDSTYTMEQLMAARKTLRCHAILIGTITEYQPYPHMVIGLHLKMISLDDGRLIWAFEQVWDTSDKITESRIKKYLANQTQPVSANMDQRLVIISSIKFLKFVAHEVALTL
jgi:hypothetical protein